MDFEPMYPGFESRESHDFFFCQYYYSANLQIQHYCLYSVSPTLLLLMMPWPPAPSALWFLNYALYAYNTTSMVQLPYVCYMDLNFALFNSLTTRDANS